MNSRTTAEFRRLFNGLPHHVQEQAQKSFRLWITDRSHPSLHFKRIHPDRPLYSVRVGLQWRAVGLEKKGAMIWFWIGSHAEYDRVLSSF